MNYKAEHPTKTQKECKAKKKPWGFQSTETDPDYWHQHAWGLSLPPALTWSGSISVDWFLALHTFWVLIGCQTL